MRTNIMNVCCIMSNEKMPRLNVYLDQATKDKLKELSDNENRPVSRQIKHMLEFYLEHKDKVK